MAISLDSDAITIAKPIMISMCMHMLIMMGFATCTGITV